MTDTTASELNESVKTPKVWRVWFMLIMPTVLIFLLTMMYAVYLATVQKFASEDIGALVGQNIGYVIILNHTLVFLLLLRFLKKDGMKLSDIGFRWPPNGARGIVADVGLAVLSVIIVVSILALVLPLFESNSVLSDTLANDDKRLGSSLVVALISGVIFAAIVEESVYRGYGITGLQRGWGIFGAVIITSLLFGPFHFGLGLISIPRTIFQGLVLALLFVRSRSLLAPIVAHSLTNFIGTASQHGLITLPF